MLMQSHGGSAQQPLDPRFRGILIALGRFLRPVWNDKIFAGNGKSVSHGEWKHLVSVLHIVSRFLSDYEDRLQGESRWFGRTREHQGETRMKRLELEGVGEDNKSVEGEKKRGRGEEAVPDDVLCALQGAITT